MFYSTRLNAPDNFLSLLQIVSGHTGKKMVLYLIIQTTIPEIVHNAAMNVARGKYLPSQKINATAFFYDRHTFVVRNKKPAPGKAQKTPNEDTYFPHSRTYYAVLLRIGNCYLVLCSLSPPKNLVRDFGIPLSFTGTFYPVIENSH